MYHVRKHSLTLWQNFVPKLFLFVNHKALAVGKPSNRIRNPIFTLQEVHELHHNERTCEILDTFSWLG